MLDGTLPKNLTAANWKSKKGVIAKMAGETGIGDSLVELKKAWDKVNWKVIEPQSAASVYSRPGHANTGDDWEEWHKTVTREQYGKLIPVMHELKDFIAIAKPLKTKWVASKKIPASSARLVDDMITSAENLGKEIKGLDGRWQATVAQMKLLDAQKLAGVRQMLKPSIKKVRDGGKTIFGNAILASYGFGQGTGFHQDVRTLSAALDQCKIAPVVAWNRQVFANFAQDAYAPQQDKQVLPKTKAILKSLDDLDRLLA